MRFCLNSIRKIIISLRVTSSKRYQNVRSDLTILGPFANVTLTLCVSWGYTMGCPPVRGDNPRALASGLSYVQAGKHGITILYHLHQCRPCTS